MRLLGYGANVKQVLGKRSVVAAAAVHNAHRCVYKLLKRDRRVEHVFNKIFVLSKEFFHT